MNSTTPGQTADAATGIAAVARLVATRPARLGHTKLVAVDGPSGSGKTTLAVPLAAALAEELGGMQVPLRRIAGPSQVAPERESLGKTSYSGAPKPQVAVVSTDLLATWQHPLDWWPTLEVDLLAPLEWGHTAMMPVIDWIGGEPKPDGFVVVPPVEVLVLEGVSSGRRAVADRLTALVWVEFPGAEARLERAVARDGEATRVFLQQWQRDEAAHFCVDGTRARADVTISG